MKSSVCLRCQATPPTRSQAPRTTLKACRLASPIRSHSIPNSSCRISARCAAPPCGQLEKIGFWAPVRFSCRFETIEPILVPIPPDFFPELVVGGEDRFIATAKDHRPASSLGFIRRYPFDFVAFLRVSDRVPVRSGFSGLDGIMCRPLLTLLHPEQFVVALEFVDRYPVLLMLPDEIGDFPRSVDPSRDERGLPGCSSRIWRVKSRTSIRLSSATLANEPTSDFL